MPYNTEKAPILSVMVKTMNEKLKSPMVNNLFRAVLSLETVEECYDLFEDLCTYKEVEQMAQRLSAAKLLMEGKTYQQVIALTDISSATLSRVSRCVQHGKGYRAVLKEKE